MLLLCMIGKNLTYPRTARCYSLARRKALKPPTHIHGVTTVATRLWRQPRPLSKKETSNQRLPGNPLSHQLIRGSTTGRWCSTSSPVPLHLKLVGGIGRHSSWGCPALQRSHATMLLPPHSCDGELHLSASLASLFKLCTGKDLGQCGGSYRVPIMRFISIGQVIVQP